MRARDNPFATDRVHRIRYEFADRTWDGFMGELAAARYRGAIVGPEGSGKTTLLEDLEPRLRALGFAVLPWRLTQEHPALTREQWQAIRQPINAIVLLDGAEQMNRWGWWMFRHLTRRATGLIITAHRPGLLNTLLRCSTHPELLSSIVQRLAGPEAASLADLQDLYHRHRGNIRDAVRELYDQAAALG